MAEVPISIHPGLSEIYEIRNYTHPQLLQLEEIMDLPSEKWESEKGRENHLEFGLCWGHTELDLLWHSLCVDFLPARQRTTSPRG